MGEITIEVEYFKDGYPVEGDFNQYSPSTYKGALYNADEAFKKDCADEVAFYLSVDDGEPEIVQFTDKTFNVEEVSEKIQEKIKHLGA